MFALLEEPPSRVRILSENCFVFLAQLLAAPLIVIPALVPGSVATFVVNRCLELTGAQKEWAEGLEPIVWLTSIFLATAVVARFLPFLARTGKWIFLPTLVVLIPECMRAFREISDYGDGTKLETFLGFGSGLEMHIVYLYAGYSLGMLAAEYRIRRKGISGGLRDGSIEPCLARLSVDSGVHVCGGGSRR